MNDELTISKAFGDVYKLLDMTRQRRAMRGAIRKEANAVKKTAASELAHTSASGAGGSITLHNATEVAKGFRVRVYPDKYGLGFLVTTKPHGRKGYHRNRQGREKPVLMWAVGGTKRRSTRSASKWFVCKKRGHSTGRMPQFDFMLKTENAAADRVERELLGEFERGMERRARRLGLM